MARSTDKTAIYERLRESLDWCNAHGSNTQQRFGEIVDVEIADPVHNAEMKALFPVLLQRELSGFRPGLSINESALALDHAAFLDLYFTTWARRYNNAWKTLPSERIAKPKGAVTDPALLAMVAAKAGSESVAGQWARHHNLFMSAENVGGNLLEEYIYTKVRDYDWIWCRGEALTAVDFCNTECTRFIQIKNKSNTENSSGKGFREDHHADKWYRMEARKKNGAVVTLWPGLVDVIKEGTSKAVPDDLLTEESYMAFLRDVVNRNPALLTDEEE